MDRYLRLTPERLIHRLINRRHHLLALRIAQHLRLPTDRIYIHWACLKIRLSSDDESTICRLIVDKLSPHRSISFESIARTAYDEGRPALATQLLNHEPQPSRQVPLLLSMSEDDLALDKAIESGDTDLIHFVLLHLKNKHPLHEFFRFVNPRPIAAALVEATAATEDRELLKDFYYQDDRRAASALTILAESLSTSPPNQEKLKVAASLLSDQKSHTFEHHALNDFQKLLAHQEAFAKEYSEPEHLWISLSLHRTIARLLDIDSHSPRAVKLKSEFKVPETTYTWIRLRALVGKRDWKAIDELIDKGSNGGVRWEAWVEECLNAGGKKSAAKAVDRCRDKRELWVRCGEWERAAQETVKRGDVGWGEKVLLPKVPEGFRGRVEEVLRSRKR